jgi:hypothetical protein
MFRSIVALGLLICMLVTNNALYAIAAGLFELAGVLYAVTRPRRLKEAPKHDAN